MRFGALHTRPARVGDDHGRLLTEFMELGIEAEQLGFWSFWTTEHHFGSDHGYRPFGVPVEDYQPTDYDLSPDPLQLLTYLAAKTTELRLGTAVIVMPWDHPVRIAERAAVLDLLSNGRLELGIGRGSPGHREMELFQVPIDPAEQVRKYQEAVEVLQGLWDQERFTFEGEYYQVRDLTMIPRPRRHPAPIWFGSASTESAAWAATKHRPYATNVWPLTDRAQYRERLNVFRSTATDAGYDLADAWVPHLLFMYCGESDSEAQETAHEYLVQFQYMLESHYEFQIKHESVRPQDSDPAFFGARAARLADVDGNARQPLESHIIGSVETCIERIEAFKSDIDINYLIANVSWGGMPNAKAIASMRRFARQVMPHFATDPIGAAAAK